MNFFCGTVELSSMPGESHQIYGGQYVSVDAYIPDRNKDFTLRLLCYDRTNPKLEAFMKMEQGQRVLVGGTFKFPSDLNAPWDLLVHTLETNIAPDTYMNQAMLGGAYLTKREISQNKDGQTYQKKLGIEPGNDEETSLITMEFGESRLKKLQAIEAARGNQISVVGGLRAWKPNDSDRLYRYVRGVDFAARSTGSKASQTAPKTGSSVGNTAAEEDPLEDWAS